MISSEKEKICQQMLATWVKILEPAGPVSPFWCGLLFFVKPRKRSAAICSSVVDYVWMSSLLSLEGESYA